MNNSSAQKIHIEPIQEEQVIQNGTLQVLGEKAAAVIHDIRAPLAGIYANLQLLERSLKNEVASQHQARFSLLYDEIKRMSTLCDQIMSLVSGHPIKHRFVDIGGVCLDTVNLLRALAISRGINLELDLAPNLPKIWAEENLLRRLLVNLVTNSIQALQNYRPDGCVIISLTPTEEGVKLTVADNGPGIDTCLKEKILEPFFTTKEEGNGLGLTLFSEIAQSNRGQITITSEPGNGTCFTLCLPRAGDQ